MMLPSFFTSFHHDSSLPRFVFVFVLPALIQSVTVSCTVTIIIHHQPGIISIRIWYERWE
jgi:hypothetical protein